MASEPNRLKGAIALSSSASRSGSESGPYQVPPSKLAKSPQPGAVQACLRRLLGGDDFTAQPTDSGVSTPVYRVVRDGAVLYLRLAEGPEADLGPEMHVHRLLAGAGCHVPEVLMYEPCAPELGRSVALLGEIAGQPVGFDPDLPDPLLEQVILTAGEELALVNRIGVDGFGWIRRDLGPDRLAGEHATLREWLWSGDDEDVEQCLAKLRQVAGLRAPAAVPGAVLRLAADPSITPRLAHGDFDLTHIFHVDGRYSGVIDFGEIRGSEPWYDLAVFLRLSDSRESAARARCYRWLRAGWLGEDRDDPELTARVRITAWLVALRFAARQLGRFGPTGRDLPWVRDAMSFVQEMWPDG